MAFLITGTSGFVGQSVVNKLAKNNQKIVIFGRTAPMQSIAEHNFFQGDITNIEQLKACKSAYPEIHTIVHLAALVPKTKEEDVAAQMCEINVRGTINLLEIFGHDLQNFVYASTAEVYGLPADAESIKESSLTVPLSHYGASKLSGEFFANVYGQHHKFPVSRLRLSVLYGPGDRINRAVPNFIKKALKGEQLEVFGGEEKRDYLHVTDAAEAFYLAAIKPIDGVYNVGTGQGVTIKETADKVIEAVGNPDVSISVLPRQKKAVDIILDPTKAEEELGFKAQLRFPQLLNEQIAWHQKNQ